jgi:hypothetical protein
MWYVPLCHSRLVTPKRKEHQHNPLIHLPHNRSEKTERVLIDGQSAVLKTSTGNRKTFARDVDEMLESASVCFTCQLERARETGRKERRRGVGGGVGGEGGREREPEGEPEGERKKKERKRENENENER